MSKPKRVIPFPALPWEAEQQVVRGDVIVWDCSTFIAHVLEGRRKECKRTCTVIVCALCEGSVFCVYVYLSTCCLNLFSFCMKGSEIRRLFVPWRFGAWVAVFIDVFVIIIFLSFVLVYQIIMYCHPHLHCRFV